MPLRNEIVRNTNIFLRPGSSDMCSYFVADVFARCGYEFNAKQKNPCHFFPKLEEREGKRDITSDIMRARSDRERSDFFIPGDIVVFYSRVSGDHISHVMIAVNECNLVGTNNTSTFPFVSGQLECVDVRTVALSDSVVCVHALPPEAIVSYHHLTHS